MAALFVVLLAVAIGIFSAIAPLGPVTVLVLSKALAGETRSAMRIGLGRVPAESMYCMLATFGVVALLERFPDVRLGIEVFGVVLFFAIGVWLMFQRPKRPVVVDDAPSPSEGMAMQRSQRWGDAAGLIISLLNPTLLLSWSAGVGVIVSMVGYQPTLFDKIAFPLALGLGIGLGYWILIAVLRRWGARIEDALVHRVIQVAGLVFVVAALRTGATLLGWL